jgi:hypothetical protein
MECSLFFLLSEMLLTISTIRYVDLPIFLLLLFLGPLVTWIKELSLGLWSLDANVCDSQQIGHQFGLLHGDLLDNLDIADPITEGINDLDVLDVQNSVPSIVETFHIILEALIMLLLDRLHSFHNGGMIVCALEVPDEHGT